MDTTTELDDLFDIAKGGQPPPETVQTQYRYHAQDAELDELFDLAESAPVEIAEPTEPQPEPLIRERLASAGKSVLGAGMGVASDVLASRPVQALGALLSVPSKALAGGLQSLETAVTGQRAKIGEGLGEFSGRKFEEALGPGMSGVGEIFGAAADPLNLLGAETLKVLGLGKAAKGEKGAKAAADILAKYAGEVDDPVLAMAKMVEAGVPRREAARVLREAGVSGEKIQRILEVQGVEGKFGGLDRILGDVAQEPKALDPRKVSLPGTDISLAGADKVSAAAEELGKNAMRRMFTRKGQRVTAATNELEEVQQAAEQAQQAQRAKMGDLTEQMAQEGGEGLRRLPTAASEQQEASEKLDRIIRAAQESQAEDAARPAAAFRPEERTEDVLTQVIREAQEQASAAERGVEKAKYGIAEKIAARAREARSQQDMTRAERALEQSLQMERSVAPLEEEEALRRAGIDIPPAQRITKHVEDPGFSESVIGKSGTGAPGIGTETFEAKLGALPVEARRIVYRDPNGNPVAAAVVMRHPDGGWFTKDFATDKSRGLLSSRAAIKVGEQLQAIGADRAYGSITDDAKRLLGRRLSTQPRKPSPAQRTPGGAVEPPSAAPPGEGDDVLSKIMSGAREKRAAGGEAPDIAFLKGAGQAAGEKRTGMPSEFYQTAPGAPAPAAAPVRPKGGKPIPRQEAVRQAAQRVGMTFREAAEGELPAGKVGTYRVHPEVAVTAYENSPGTFAHEVGHHLDDVLLNQRQGPGAMNVDPHVKYLESLPGVNIPAAGTTPADATVRRAEAWAEAVRTYVEEPAKYDATPEGRAFRSWLERELSSRDPKMLEALAFLQGNEQKIRGMTPWERMGMDFVDRKYKTTVPSNLNPADKWLMDYVDDNVGARRLTEEARKRGVKFDATEDFGLQVRSMRNVGADTEYMVEFGPKSWATGEKVPGIPGLRTIYEMSDDPRALMKYAAAKRDIELANRGKPIVTGPGSNRSLADARAAVDYVENQMPKEAAKKIMAANDLRKRFNRAVMDYYREGGMLDDTTYNKLIAENENYLRYERVGKANQGALRKIQGSDKEIVDPLQSEVRHLVTMVKTANQNRMAQILHKYAAEGKGLGKWVEIRKTMTQAKSDVDDLEDLAKHFDEEVQGIDAGEGKVLVRMRNRNGAAAGLPQESVLAVDKDVWDSVARYTPKQSNWFTKMLQGTAGLFRRGVVEHVAFGVPAFIKDVRSSTLTSQAQRGIGSAWSNGVRGLFESMGRGELYEKALADRALMTGMSAVESLTPERVSASLGRKGWVRGVLGTLSKYVGPEASKRIESGVRMGEYRAMMSRLAAENPGMSEKAMRAMAADAARTVGIDFLTKGRNPTMAWLQSVSPFWNPSIQGWRNDIEAVGRLVKSNPAALAPKAVAMAVPSIIAWYTVKDDPRYRQQSVEKRVSHDYLSLGDGNPFLRIPRAPGALGKFQAMMVMAMDAAYKADPTVADDVRDLWLSEGMGLMPLVSNPLVKGGYEAVSGRRADSPLRDVVPGRYKKLEGPDQAYDNTTNLARWIGKGAEAVGAGERLSPIAADRQMRTFGGLYGELAGAVTGPWGGSRPWYESIPGLRSFLSSGDVSMPAQVERMGTRMRELDRVKATFDHKKNTDLAAARDYMASHREALAEQKRMSQYDDRLGKMFDQAKRLEGSSLADEEKRARLRTLRAKMAELATQALSK